MRNGCIEHLKLPENGAVVLSFKGNDVKGQVIVHAQVNGLHTKPGEHVFVTGNVPELGEWKVDNAYPLEYINENTWLAQIPFNESAGKLVMYRYLIKREGSSAERENTTAREWVLPKEGIVKWRDSWQG